MSDIRIEGYSVAFALAETGPEPVSLSLYDLPGCGVQGRTFDEAMDKLRLLVQEYLRLLRERGVSLPTPSPQPGFQVGLMVWDSPMAVVAQARQAREALRAAPIRVILGTPGGVQRVEIGAPIFAEPVTVG
jgi:predicted RNase H-like HicB family nuclease